MSDAKFKNPGFITCTIDGKEVVVKPGTNMIEAARLAGSDIPYYCYHPRLSIAASCRVCLVEASNAPKLVPACQTPLVEGQTIKTNTPKVKEFQRADIEFLLLNHPVDCPICDQAGECKLQDYYTRYDFKPSRLEGNKVLKAKRKILGPLVVIDQERCILCSRCVRFMREVAQKPQLGIFGRGSHECIDVFPESELDSNYSGNIVDICPVGALLNRDFRFQARAWFLSTAPSVCTGCSRGCTINVDYFGQDIYRYRPRENEAINKSWLCDQGRLSYKYLALERIQTSLIGRGADRHEASQDEAAKYAAIKLKPLVGTTGLAVLVSPVASNEDLLATLSFAKKTLCTTSIFVGGRPPGPADQFLMTADKNPNRKGLEWIAKSLGLELRSFEQLLEEIGSGQVKSLYATGGEVPVEGELFERIAQKLEFFVVQTFNRGPTASAAHVVLATSPHVEDQGSFVQEAGIIQRFCPAFPSRGESYPHWKWAGLLSSEMGVDNIKFDSARDVWAKLSGSVSELSSFDWDANTPLTKKRLCPKSLSTAADGRPPGYREFGIPRVRGI